MIAASALQTRASGPFGLKPTVQSADTPLCLGLAGPTASGKTGAAIALALYAVESALPPIVPIPGVKLGLANIITLVVLWKYSTKDAFFVLLVRILLATLFFGQVISLLYSLSGGLLCLLAMVFVQRLLHGHYLFLASMTGAVFHNLGQIGVAFLLTSVPAVLVYLPFLLLSGLVTGMFIGLCAHFTLRFLP